MVEVAGVEPASPVLWCRASTDLSFLLSLAGAKGEKARFLPASVLLIYGPCPDTRFGLCLLTSPLLLSRCGQRSVAAQLGGKSIFIVAV